MLCNTARIKYKTKLFILRTVKYVENFDVTQYVCTYIMLKVIKTSIEDLDVGSAHSYRQYNEIKFIFVILKHVVPTNVAACSRYSNAKICRGQWFIIYGLYRVKMQLYFLRRIKIK